MQRKILFPIIIGLVGVAILSSLGVWQCYRLSWKNEILTNIENKLIAAPVALEEELNEAEDQYLSVVVTGELQPQEIHVLTSIKNIGPGYLVISPLRLPTGKLIMVDMGFIPEKEKNVERLQGHIKIIGNLLWPNEIDSFTPQPNIERNIWFGRDLIEMGKYLRSDPILVVARDVNLPQMPIPQPIGIHISNNHLSYAITWFSLAVVWFGMTILLVYRIRTKND